MWLTSVWGTCFSSLGPSRRIECSLCLFVKVYLLCAAKRLLRTLPYAWSLRRVTWLRLLRVRLPHGLHSLRRLLSKLSGLPIVIVCSFVTRTLAVKRFSEVLDLCFIFQAVLLFSPFPLLKLLVHNSLMLLSVIGTLVSMVRCSCRSVIRESWLTAVIVRSSWWCSLWMISPIWI